MRPLSREVVVEKAKGGKAKTPLLAGAFSTSAVPACRHQKKRKGPFCEIPAVAAEDPAGRRRRVSGFLRGPGSGSGDQKKSLSLPRTIISQACFARAITL